MTPISVAEQISKLVSQAAQTDLEEDLTVFGEAAEKAGLSPEFHEEGSLIQDAIEESDDDTEKTWSDSPFAPAGDL